MEEIPSLNMPIQRLKVAILPLDLPCSGPVAHSEEILTIGKSHGKRPDYKQTTIFSTNRNKHIVIPNVSRFLSLDFRCRVVASAWWWWEWSGVWSDLDKCNKSISSASDDVMSNVRLVYNNINNQLDATITVFINNTHQLNVFRAMISPILRSTRLCLQLVV